jgi:chorismate-pyruvate lyase
MTVTVEAHHGDEVRTRILNVHRDGDFYARRILLELKGSGRVVQYGIVRVNLAECAPAVREEIVAGQKPFGRVLIDHDVMRRIEPTEFLRIIPGPNMMHWFGLQQPEPTYGRLALIHCDERPAVELVEIVIPEN